MADTLTLEITAAVDWLFYETTDLTQVSDSYKMEWKEAWTDGTGSGQVTAIWHDKRLLAGAGTDTIDLLALPATWFGNSETMSFQTIRTLAVVNLNTTAGDDLYIDTAQGANPWQDPWGATTEIEIPADSVLLTVNKVAGWSVAAGDKTITIVNDSANEIAYKILLAGRLT